MRQLPSSDLPPLPRRGFLGTTLALLTLAAPVAGARASTEDAEAFIRDIGAEVMAILQDPGKTNDDKFLALKQLLESKTDLDLVARLVLGRHWRDATEPERAEYVALFRQILMNTLAARLGDYNGQTFAVLGSTELNERDTAVQSQINRVGGAPPLKVDWRVRDSDGELAIIDVVAEGVSLVVSQRNEVGSVVDRNGMSGLIETMRERSTEGSTVL